MKVTGRFSETLEFLPYEILTTIKKYAKKKKLLPIITDKRTKRASCGFMRTKVKIMVISEEPIGWKKVQKPGL